MIDLYSLMDRVVSSIPKGRVSTYGLVAEALGDRIAARAVATRATRPPPGVPYHRVVASDGKVGEFRDSPGKKVEALRAEGVEVSGGRVDLSRYLFENLPRIGILEELRKEQEELKRRLRLEPLGGVRLVAAADVAYSGDTAFAVAVLYDLKGEMLAHKWLRIEVRFPYIPTYLSYRELEPMMKVLEGLDFDLVLVDGNGILHPRGLGIASHLGVLMGVPTIGVAKSLLTGRVIAEGGREYVVLAGRRVGAVLRAGRRTFFVSPGNLCTLEDAIRIVEKFMTKKGPVPLVVADRMTKELKRRFMRGLGP